MKGAIKRRSRKYIKEIVIVLLKLPEEWSSSRRFFSAPLV